MNTSSSSHRIGNRASKATEYASSSESSVLRSLFELRKSYSQQSDNDCAVRNLIFWNCTWSPRIIQSLRKILVRDRRRFSSIKFFDCAIQSDDTNSQLFEEILQMVLFNNSTDSLIIKGGRLIGNNNNASQQQSSQSSCRFSSAHCSSASLANALRERLSTKTSLKSLTLSGLDFSSASAVEDLSIALSQNSTLESVNVRKSSLDDESIAQILRSVMGHPSLTSLDLSKNYLGARKSNAAFSPTTALDTVAELLRSKSSKLEHLNLSNQYQMHPRESTSTQSLSQQTKEDVHSQICQHRAAFGKAFGALSTNQSLKSIDLSCNPGCLLDPSSVEALAVCLSTNSCLEYANVSDCDMTPESIAYLARECLPFCGTSLKSLVLFGGHLETTAASQKNLDNSVSSCPTTVVRSEALGFENKCCGASAPALEKGLLLNMTLESLGDLPSDNKNETINETYKRIQHVLNLNKAGRRAFRSSLPLATWSHLLTRAGNLEYNRSLEDSTKHQGGNDTASVLFSLLRQGPILMEH